MLMTCPICEGMKFVKTENPIFSLATCTNCCGSGVVDAELAPGVKATFHSCADRTPFVVCHVFSDTHVGLVEGDDLNGIAAAIITEATLRKDGRWRKKGSRKGAGYFEFGIAREHRSREV